MSCHYSEPFAWEGDIERFLSIFFFFLRGIFGALGNSEHPSFSKRDHPTFTLNKTSWFIQGALTCLTEKPDYFIIFYSELFGLFPFRNAHFSGIILIRSTVDASSVFPRTPGLLWTHCFHEFHNTSSEVGYYCCFPEKHLLLLYWLCQSLWLCGSQQTVEKFSRDMNTRPPYLHPEKSVVRSRSNS